MNTVRIRVDSMSLSWAASFQGASSRGYGEGRRREGPISQMFLETDSISLVTLFDQGRTRVVTKIPAQVIGVEEGEALEVDVSLDDLRLACRTGGTSGVATGSRDLVLRLDDRNGRLHWSAAPGFRFADTAAAAAATDGTLAAGVGTAVVGTGRTIASDAIPRAVATQGGALVDEADLLAASDITGEPTSDLLVSGERGLLLGASSGDGLLVFELPVQAPGRGGDLDEDPTPDFVLPKSGARGMALLASSASSKVADAEKARLERFTTASQGALIGIMGGPGGDRIEDALIRLADSYLDRCARAVSSGQVKALTKIGRQSMSEEETIEVLEALEGAVERMGADLPDLDPESEDPFGARLDRMGRAWSQTGTDDFLDLLSDREALMVGRALCRAGARARAGLDPAGSEMESEWIGAGLASYLSMEDQGSLLRDLHERLVREGVIPEAGRSDWRTWANGEVGGDVKGWLERVNRFVQKVAPDGSLGDLAGFWTGRALEGVATDLSREATLFGDDDGDLPDDFRDLKTGATITPGEILARLGSRGLEAAPLEPATTGLGAFRSAVMARARVLGSLRIQAGKDGASFGVNLGAGEWAAEVRSLSRLTPSAWLDENEVDLGAVEARLASDSATLRVRVGSDHARTAINRILGVQGLKKDSGLILAARLTTDREETDRNPIALQESWMAEEGLPVAEAPSEEAPMLEIFAAGEEGEVRIGVPVRSVLEGLMGSTEVVQVDATGLETMGALAISGSRDVEFEFSEDGDLRIRRSDSQRRGVATLRGVGLMHAPSEVRDLMRFFVDPSIGERLEVGDLTTPVRPPTPAGERLPPNWTPSTR